MSTSKPGLFSRLKRAISSSLTDAVDAVSDPGQEVALMLDDLAAQLKHAEKDLQQMVVERKMLEKKLETLVADETSWQQRAERALGLGDETLARAALQRKTEITTERTTAEQAIADQRQVIEDMQSQIREGQSKWKTLNLRRGTLMARARAAKRGGTSGLTSQAGSRMGDIEGRIAQLEAMNELAQEDIGGRAQEAAVDAKLAALDGDSKVDDALEQLKAKLKNQSALPERKG